MKKTDKSYNWEEIEALLRESLKSKESIVTCGTIGSRDVRGDIDLIAMKNPDSKSSDYFREVHSLFEEINDYIKDKHNAKLVTTRRFVHEMEVCELSKAKGNDLIIQAMTYVSWTQLLMHWHPDMIHGESVKEMIEREYYPLKGESKDVFLDSKKKTHDAMFCYLNDGDKINAQYDEEVLLSSMNNLFDFIIRKRLKLDPRYAKNREEAKEITYYICDELDKRSKVIK